jgi:diadenosine tetraphosphate (Ap4A) HIT family hydrolase
MECAVCGFTLWSPIASLTASHLSLYDDARFPGRSILMLDTHEENLEDVEEELLFNFMKDIQVASKALKQATGSERVNVAILGNTVAHVHAHLIPRFPDMEEFPHSSPWNDQREKTALDTNIKTTLIAKIASHIFKDNPLPLNM